MDGEDIFINHLIIIIKSEVSTFPIVVIFLVAVCLRRLYHHMLWVSYMFIKSWVFCRLLLRSLMVCANNRVNDDPMVVFVCLHIPLPHYHHYADLPEGIKFLNAGQVHSVWSVCLRLSQFSQLSFMQHMGLCIFSLPIYLMIIVSICVLYLITIIKSEVWPICHCLGLGNETVVCAVCLFIFLYINRYHEQMERNS